MEDHKLPVNPCGVTIEDALALDPSLKGYLMQRNPPRLDLGNKHALLLYNQIVLKSFLNLYFSIPQGFLIPTICSRWEFIKWILKDSPKSILEIGTGASAIIALILAKLGCHVTATEVNEDAFTSAMENIKINNLEKEIKLVLTKSGSFFQPFQSLSLVEAIICNPPQYDEEFFRRMNSQNRGFQGNKDELVGGPTGTEFIFKLIDEIEAFTSPPPLYFQLTLPKLRKPINLYLKKTNINFRETKQKIGTRHRIYYKITFEC